MLGTAIVPLETKSLTGTARADELIPLQTILATRQHRVKTFYKLSLPDFIVLLIQVDITLQGFDKMAHPSQEIG